MAKTCAICNKGKQYGNKVSFSNKKYPRNWSPNLKRVRANVDGTPRRINVCTKCIKSNRVERA